MPSFFVRWSRNMQCNAKLTVEGMTSRLSNPVVSIIAFRCVGLVSLLPRKPSYSILMLTFIPQRIWRHHVSHHSTPTGHPPSQIHRRWRHADRHRPPYGSRLHERPRQLPGGQRRRNPTTQNRKTRIRSNQNVSRPPTTRPSPEDDDSGTETELDREPTEEEIPLGDFRQIIPQALIDMELPDEDPKYQTAANIISDCPGPPSMPLFLGKSVLNGQLPLKDDSSVLPLPNHTVLNHLATSSLKNGVLATSVTTRYMKKVSRGLRGICDGDANLW